MDGTIAVFVLTQGELMGMPTENNADDEQSKEEHNLRLFKPKKDEYPHFNMLKIHIVEEVI